MVIAVTAAILRRDGLILLARRAAGRHLEGKWEFPGGKIEDGETAAKCLERELKEEFDIEARIGAFVADSVYEYPEAQRVIHLLAYETEYLCGEFRLRDHDQLAWVEAKCLGEYDLAPADIPIAAHLAATARKDRPSVQSDQAENDIALADRLRWLSVGWAVRYLAGQEAGADFHVIQHSAQHHSPSRPLVVLVHPGDMIMFADSYDPPERRAATVAFWSFIGTGTRKELAEFRQNGADFCVLHRRSSTEFPGFSRSRAVGFNLYQEIKAGHNRGTVLYGDDLKAAVKWMMKNLLIRERPRVHLSGAYSDPQHGCLTFIGKAFEKVVGSERITVSPFSPPENSPGMMWRVGSAPRPMQVPLELKKLYKKAERLEARLQQK